MRGRWVGEENMIGHPAKELEPTISPLPKTQTLFEPSSTHITNEHAAEIQMFQNMFISKQGWERASRIVPAHNDVWV